MPRDAPTRTAPLILGQPTTFYIRQSMRYPPETGYVEISIGSALSGSSNCNPAQFVCRTPMALYVIENDDGTVRHDHPYFDVGMDSTISNITIPRQLFWSVDRIKY
jgi:hypothetical protein